MMPALDHVTIDVSDYARAKSFYERALDGHDVEAVCHTA